MVSNMTLTYFDLGGRAEACRMILSHGKVDFTDNRISGEQFGEMKKSGELAPTAQLPFLEVEGNKMNQSEAIARFCAMKTGIYNTADPKACWRDDMVINTISDHQQ